jgi:hypothetical protein
MKKLAANKRLRSEGIDFYNAIPGLDPESRKQSA